MKPIKNITRSITTFALTMVLIVLSVALPCFAATNIDRGSSQIPIAASHSFYASQASSVIGKINNFTKDSRWKNGISWGYYQKPKISSYSSIGCCAYVSDFVKYVYGRSNPYDGARYYNINEIRTGDVVYIDGHWFAVLNREGSTLTCAEGNWQSKVSVGRKRTIISGANRFNDSNRSFKYGIHYTNVSPKIVVPSKPGKVSGLKVTKTTKNSISISWKKVSGTNIQYEVWDGNKKLATTSGTSFTHTGLKKKSVHTYQIRAYVTYYGSDYLWHTVYGNYSTAVVGVTNKK